MPSDENRKPSSTELASRLRAGDNGAADALVERFEPWLRRIVERKIGPRLRRRVDAEDIMQSAFWSFCRRTSDGQYEFEHSGALCRLLLTITDNKIRRVGTHHMRQCRSVAREDTVDVANLELSDDRWQEEASDLIEDVAYIVDQLAPRDAEFFRRRYFLGHSAGQISAETGWSLATVKRVLKRTVEDIRARTQDDR